MEPLGGSSLIASAGTDINMQDDEDMNAVFISLLCTILSPGGGGGGNPPETESSVKSI